MLSLFWTALTEKLFLQSVPSTMSEEATPPKYTLDKLDSTTPVVGFKIDAEKKN